MTKHFCDRCDREIGEQDRYRYCHPKTNLSFEMNVNGVMEDVTAGMFCEPCTDTIREAWKTLCKEVRANKA